MATVPFQDPRVDGIIADQRADRAEAKSNFTALLNRIDKLDAKFDLRVQSLEDKIEGRMDARRWTPGAWSVVLGPAVASMITVIGILLTSRP